MLVSTAKHLLVVLLQQHLKKISLIFFVGLLQFSLYIQVLMVFLDQLIRSEKNLKNG